VTAHDLMLAVAGRVDDDLLTWARELVAGGEEARAVELLAAALIAERVALPEPVRTALVAAGRATRSVLDVDAGLPPVRAEEATPHVFDASAAGPVTDGVAATTGELLQRQGVEGCAWLAWRRTPAGSATGPLPHPVLLVELAVDGDAADVLAYQLGTALERAGMPASVEVFARAAALPAYQLAARRAGRLLDTSPATQPDPQGERPSAWPAFAASSPVAVPADPRPPRHGRETSESAAPEPPADVTAPAHDAPGRHGADQQSDRSPVEPDRAERWTTDTGTSHDPEPERDVPPAVNGPPASLSPPVPHVPGAEPARPRPRPRAVPADHDPVHGPLPEPLLAPLLEPTNDPGADAPASSSVESLFTSRTAGSGGFGPVPPEASAQRSTRSGSGTQQFGGARAPHHPQVPPPDAPQAAADPEAVTPVQGTRVLDPQLGLRPESLERLSPTDRALLARLQSELHKSRPGRGTQPDQAPRLRPRGDTP